jgi:hypothetical protein
MQANQAPGFDGRAKARSARCHRTTCSSPQPPRLCMFSLSGILRSGAIRTCLVDPRSPHPGVTVCYSAPPRAKMSSPDSDPKPPCPVIWSAYTRQWVLRTNLPSTPPVASFAPIKPPVIPPVAPVFAPASLQRHGDQGGRGLNHMGAFEQWPRTALNSRARAAAALI